MGTLGIEADGYNLRFLSLVDLGVNSLAGAVIMFPIFQQLLLLVVFIIRSLYFSLSAFNQFLAYSAWYVCGIMLAATKGFIQSRRKRVLATFAKAPFI